MACNHDTTYFLIRNSNGKYLYNTYYGRGFVNTPRYINFKITKDQVIDTIEFASDELGSIYFKEIMDDLTGTTIMVYNFDLGSGEMLRNSSMPPMNLSDFCKEYQMPETAELLNYLITRAKT